VTQKNWHIQREATRMTLARHLPVRFDVAASAQFPVVSKTRLAQQIRQDLWRRLQNVRGFSPVVQIEQADGVLNVTAGGRAAYPVSRGLEAKIETLLNDASKRRRWIACAGGGH
jgi:hypothetical protein